MTHSNIGRFDEMVGQVFARLYQSFPVPVHLRATDLMDQDTATAQGANSRDAQRTPEIDFCMYSLKWLVDAGYLSAGEASHFALPNAVLTAKGLETLKAMPASLNAPLGERIVAAAKTEGRQALRSLVAQALSAGFNLLAR